MPSFTRYYWAFWIAALGLYLLSWLRFTPGDGIVWFALATGLGSGGVFQFELGRLMGFLKAHSPAEHAALQSKRYIETLAFLHPSMLRHLWRPNHASNPAQQNAFRIYRSAWVFSLTTMAILLFLVSIYK